MKHASLPMGAVEIGTIAEAETDDEEDEEVIEGKETNPLLISTGFLKYPLELKKKFS